MPQKNTTSRERILTTLAHNEPDRVPFFLPVSLHGAKELGISLPEYFASAKNIVEAQLRLRGLGKCAIGRRGGYDCLFRSCLFFHNHTKRFVPEDRLSDCKTDTFSNKRPRCNAHGFRPLPAYLKRDCSFGREGCRYQHPGGFGSDKGRL